MTVECIECIENDARMNDKTMMCLPMERKPPTRAGANCTAPWSTARTNSANLPNIYPD